MKYVRQVLAYPDPAISLSKTHIFISLTSFIAHQTH